MEPLRLVLAYETAAGARELHVEPPQPFTCEDVRIDVRWDGEALDVSVQPAAPLRLTRVEVQLGHDLGQGARVLPNGYQSWTTTQWLGARDRMLGLDHVPRAVVDRWALDAGGDYRWTTYDPAPGRFHGFTYVEVRDGAGGSLWLVASLDERRGFLRVDVDCAAGVVALVPECPEAPLAAGERCSVLRAAVLREGVDAAGGTGGEAGGAAAGEAAGAAAGATAVASGGLGASDPAAAAPDAPDAFDAARGRAYGRWLARAGVTCRAQRPLVGYSSWYRHYEDIDEPRICDDLAATSALLDGCDLRALRPVFQIDDGWCRKGDWLAPEPGRFPHGMAVLAEAAHREGLTPGLWLAPFVAERDSALFRRHPDWLLRDEAGEPVVSGSHWSGHAALDTRNPAVRAYVTECLQTVVHEWGFGLLKLDFLYAACLLPHNGLNRGQLMADAWDLLRQAAGEDCLLLACGVPLGSVLGRADYCRIGCDVGLSWDDYPHMRMLHRERVSTKNSLANTASRAPLDGRAFGCDPDVVFLRDDVRLSAVQREQLLTAAERCGSVLFTSDDVRTWNAAQRGRFERAVAQMTGRPQWQSG